MPRATIDTTQTERFELKSLPSTNENEGGFVELRKLSYGQILERRDMGAKIAIEGLSDRQSRDEDLKVTTEMIQKAVTEFEFKHSIVSHNLEDENGTNLNFSRPSDVWALDPQIGQEIGNLIEDMNQWEADLQGKDAQTSKQESTPASY